MEAGEEGDGGGRAAVREARVASWRARRCVRSRRVKDLGSLRTCSRKRSVSVEEPVHFCGASAWRFHVRGGRGVPCTSSGSCGRPRPGRA